MSEPNLRGPENVPPKDYVKDYTIVITVWDLANDKAIREERINYGNPEHRRWLGKITYWACIEGYSIETMSEETAAKYK